MAFDRPRRILLYWGGEITYEGGTMSYRPMMSKKLFRINQRISFVELVDKIYEFMEVDREQMKLNIVYRHIVSRGVYSDITLTDDDGMEGIFDLFDADPNFCADDQTAELVHPGPYVHDIISPMTPHRARSIFYDLIDDSTLQVKRCDGTFWDHMPIPTRVWHYICLAGFEGVASLGRISVDHALITSLVERWRPETHSFHLPIGEATITLQDVEVLWGLHIDGPPVTGRDTTHSADAWSQLCMELLGFMPARSDIDGGRLKVGCLSAALDRLLPDDVTDDMCRQMARTYLLVLIGGILFSDNSGNKVPLLYLQLLRDLETVGRYSWGSAVLGTLYRSFCNATSPTARTICGPVLLVQLWTWERMPTLRPIRLEPAQEHHGAYGSRWDVGFDLRNAPRHVLSVFRDQLHILRPNEFIWQPFSDELLDMLPHYCTAGRDIWRAVTYLICWEIVECYLPHRIMRQFGLHQPIPDQRLIGNQAALHLTDRRGRANTDWELTHRQ
ncbi:hypothetical protein ACH5RR_008961 [Cinchona calisaya]|uniref:Aminotransferase-like plant mobile domain-containing protein n=1 Tax=Cinchona calisaya TaxID=153742 RepID=A0ABD3AEM4_9GENT